MAVSLGLALELSHRRHLGSVLGKARISMASDSFISHIFRRHVCHVHYGNTGPLMTSFFL
jgi:hypothetical protein